jgi:hypothetical protein
MMGKKAQINNKFLTCQNTAAEDSVNGGKLLSEKKDISEIHKRMKSAQRFCRQPKA